jgi:hypothetical protein
MKKLKEMGFDRESIDLIVRYLRVYRASKPVNVVDTSIPSKLLDVADGRLKKLLKRYDVHDIHLNKVRYGLDEYLFVNRVGVVIAVEVVLMSKTLTNGRVEVDTLETSFTKALNQYTAA